MTIELGTDFHEVTLGSEVYPTFSFSLKEVALVKRDALGHAVVLMKHCSYSFPIPDIDEANRLIEALEDHYTFEVDVLDDLWGDLHPPEKSAQVPTGTD